VTGWEPLECTGTPPGNACGYPSSQNVINGPLGGGSACLDWATGPLTDYAHRCHPISGLVPGGTVQFRWRFTSDVGEAAGFYLDDIAVTNVTRPNACVPDTCAGQADGSACNAGMACSVGDACSEAPATPAPSVPPPRSPGYFSTAARAPPCRGALVAARSCTTSSRPRFPICARTGRRRQVA
jgi:hypothetical protein